MLHTDPLHDFFAPAPDWFVELLGVAGIIALVSLVIAGFAWFGLWLANGGMDSIARVVTFADWRARRRAHRSAPVRETQINHADRLRRLEGAVAELYRRDVDREFRPHPNCKSTVPPVDDEAQFDDSPFSVRNAGAHRGNHWLVRKPDGSFNLVRRVDGGNRMAYHQFETRPEWPTLTKWFNREDLTVEEWSSLRPYGIEFIVDDPASRLARVKADLEAVTARQSQLIIHLRTAIANMEAKGRRRVAAIRKLEAALADRNADVQHWETYSSGLSRVIEQQAARVRTLSEKVDVLTRTRHLLQGAFDNLSADRGQVLTSYRNASDQVDALRQEVADRDAIIDDYHDRETRVRALLGDAPILSHLGDVQKARDVLAETEPTTGPRNPL